MKRRNQIALTPDEQRRYLEESHTIILTTLDRHGYPHSVAMWYAVDTDGSVVMTTFAKAQKAVNIRRDPRCALLVETGRAYQELKGLLIRGRATLEADPEGTLNVLERIQRKHLGDVPGLRDALRSQASKRVVIRVRPERVATWDHQKLGGVY
jgi:PPOX class probable F420-dependent enzyme